MTKEELANRISELGKTISESVNAYQQLKATLDNAVNNHNILLGRLEEAKVLYKELYEKDESVVVDAVVS